MTHDPEWINGNLIYFDVHTGCTIQLSFKEIELGDITSIRFQRNYVVTTCFGANMA